MNLAISLRRHIMIERMVMFNISLIFNAVVGCPLVFSQLALPNTTGLKRYGVNQDLRPSPLTEVMATFPFY
jgi:hypothetical protein